MKKFLEVYKNNFLVLNFHFALTIIFWVGFVYAYLKFGSFIKLFGLILFMLMLYITFIWLIGTHTLLMEIYLYLFGKEIDAQVVDLKNEGKFLRPIVRFKKGENYISLEHYRKYSFAPGVKTCRVYYSQYNWMSPQLAYLEFPINTVT
jgi:hypothetical protein